MGISTTYPEGDQKAEIDLLVKKTELILSTLRIALGTISGGRDRPKRIFLPDEEVPPPPPPPPPPEDDEVGEVESISRC